jgi:hypothetical protein
MATLRMLPMIKVKNAIHRRGPSTREKKSIVFSISFHKIDPLFPKAISSFREQGFSIFLFEFFEKGIPFGSGKK